VQAEDGGPAGDELEQDVVPDADAAERRVGVVGEHHLGGAAHVLLGGQDPLGQRLEHGGGGDGLVLVDRDAAEPAVIDAQVDMGGGRAGARADGDPAVGVGGAVACELDDRGLGHPVDRVAVGDVAGHRCGIDNRGRAGRTTQMRRGEARVPRSSRPG
jgi:hypothetical protein